jgi:CubicO group peptidase (beta-lactamase class C family)
VRRLRRDLTDRLASRAVATPDATHEISAAMTRCMAEGEFPGYVAAVSIDGTAGLCYGGQLGFDDPRPMRADTIFRVASLSKLVGAVLTLTLVADGRLALEDPVATWLPELTAPRVLGRLDGPLTDTVPAERPILVGDLLKLTCGFGFVLERGPLFDAMKRDSLMPGPFSPPCTADEFMRRLGALPLAAQPGEAWLYHTGFDALAALLQRATGRPCGELLSERVTGPLGMVDTAFQAPADRLPVAYRPSRTGLVILDPPDGRFAQPPPFEAFGSGLVSTAPDLLAFLEMLLAGGGRVLGGDAVAAMTADQLDDRQRATAGTFLGPGRSWGLGGERVLAQAGTAVAAGGFGWMGGTGTTAYIDAERRLAAVLLTQRSMESSLPPPFMQRFWEAVYRGR